MRTIYYLSCILFLLFWSCDLSEVHLNELLPDTFERVIEQQADSIGLTINGVTQLTDGTIVVIGTKSAVCTRNKEAIGFIMELADKGEIQSISELSTVFPFCTASEIPLDIVALDNNEYAICGYEIVEEKSRFYVSIGNKTYRYEKKEGRANGLIATKDGGIIAVGWIKEDGIWNGYITKLDSNLETVWEKTVGDNDTPDNEYDDILSITDIVADDINKFTVVSQGIFLGSKDIYTVTIMDTSITFEHKASYLNFFAKDLIHKTSNGLYLISNGQKHAGQSWSKVDANTPAGQKEWESPFYEMAINDLQPTEDGGFLIFGASFSNPDGDVSPADALLIKIDANGQEEWQQRYGGNLTDQGYQIVPLEDGGYMLIGINRSISSEDEVPGSKGIYIIRTDENGAVN